MQWEEFWWNNITGARTVVDRVTMALKENKMAVLRVPSDLPWRYSMRSAIQTAFNEQASFRDTIIETIDAVDDNPTNLEPGRFILQKYASSEVRAGYREKSRKSIQEYISERNVINNRIIWIKGLDEKTAGNWLQFCRGFPPSSAAHGLFVLEARGEVAVAESKMIECIDFNECVSNYDVQQFNSFVLGEQKGLSNEWKRYISTVAAMVCGVDAEVSELLLRTVDFRTDTAVDGIRCIAEDGDFERRGADDNSDHPLWHYRHNGTPELLHRTWTAQVQVLFPLIELERQKMIEKWHPDIQKALQNYPVTQYGVDLCEPAEVELGTLCYMMSHRIADDHYMLYIPNPEDREWIRFLHDCRNKLAHMNCCSPADVVGLLG